MLQLQIAHKEQSSRQASSRWKYNGRKGRADDWGKSQHSQMSSTPSSALTATENSVQGLVFAGIESTANPPQTDHPRSFSIVFWDRPVPTTIYFSCNRSTCPGRVCMSRNPLHGVKKILCERKKELENTDWGEKKDCKKFKCLHFFKFWASGNKSKSVTNAGALGRSSPQLPCAETKGQTTWRTKTLTWRTLMKERR